MKIRTQLIAGIVIFALLLAIISGFVIATNQQVEHIIDEEELANKIALEIGELGYLSNDYILYREPQQAERWNTKFASISEDIASLSPGQPEQQVIATNLASNLRNSKLIFDDIALSPVQPGGSDTVFVQLSWSRMAVQNQGMIFDAGRLAHLLRDQAEELRQTRLLLILALMGTFVAFLLTSYFLFYRRTLKSLDSLQDGATLVGSGDFSHVIDESSDDEIGDLARSFNRMTVNLRNVTASKSDLEQEVAERKRAEEDLKTKNDELNAINEELTATQEELHQNIEELTKAEQEVRTSREQYRNLFETMAEGFAVHEIIVDDQGTPVDYRFLSLNPAFEKLTGLKKSDVVGKRITEIMPDIEPYWIKTYGEVALTGKQAHFENYSKGLDRHFEVDAYSPEYGKFAALFLDITVRKKAEQALKESEERYRLVADFTYDWEFWVNPEGKLRYVSPAAERILGRPVRQDSSLEELLRQIVHPDDLVKCLAHLEDEKIGIGHFEMEYRIIRSDNEVRWIHHVCQPIYDAGGKFLGTRGSNRDITVRKRMGEKLETTLQRFYLVLSNMNYGILLVKDDGRIEFVNQAFCEFFDLKDSPADLSNLSANEMIEKIRYSYRNPDAAIARIGEIVRQGQMVRDEDVAMRSGRVFLRDFIPILLGEKQYGRLWIHIDITERRKAEEELIRTNEDLNALNEELTATQEELHQNVDELIRREHDLSRALAEKEVLLSEIHHRVKNNLTAFISLLSLEGSTEDTPAGKMLKQDLQNRARSMALIHETLYRTNMYDEVDMGIYLTTLVHQIANSFRTAKGVKTIVDAQGVILDIPRATPAGLIVNELVTNSFKYAFPDSFDSAVVRNAPPTITVTFEQDSGGYRMIVSDNGIGLPSGFDLAKTKTLGLKLVNFLAKHQMRAEVEVRANKGTEFIFRMIK